VAARVIRKAHTRAGEGDRSGYSTHRVVLEKAGRLFRPSLQRDRDNLPPARTHIPQVGLLPHDRKHFTPSDSGRRSKGGAVDMHSELRAPNNLDTIDSKARLSDK